MRSPRWRKVRRDLWLHKARTSLVILGVAVGILGAGSVLSAWSLVRQATRDEFRASNPASATLRTDSVDDALVARVAALPSIALVEVRRTVIASVRTRDGWRTAVLFAASALDTKRIGVLRPERGAWPPPDGAIVVEASSLDFAGAAVGDVLDVQVGNASPRSLAVAGVARDVGLAPGWMEHVVYAFLASATLARLGVSAAPNEMQILVRDPAMSRDAVRQVANEAKSVIERAGGRVTDIDVPVPGRHIHAGQIESLLLTQLAFGVLALVLSSILVVNLISAMLTGQRREIGVMKVLGARVEQIAVMYLTVASFLGLVACVIAIPLAAVIGRAYAQFTADLLNFDITGIAIPASVFVAQFVVGAILPVVAAAIPVWRGCRIPVGDALRDFGLSAQPPRRPGQIGIRLGGVGRPMLLSLRNAFRKRQRMALTLLALSTGGAVYLGALNLRASIIGSVDLLFGGQHFDFVLHFAQPHSADSLVAAVRKVAGISQVEAWGGTRAARSRPDGTLGSAFPVTAPPLATRMLDLRILRGRGFTTGRDNMLVVNRRLIEDDPAFDLDSTVTLIIDGHPTRWTVGGVVETGPTPAAYTAREILARVIGDGGANGVVVAATSRNPASLLDLIQRLRSSLGEAGLDVQTAHVMAQQRQVIEDHLLMVAGFLGIMGQLMIVVGGLGLASTMSLAVLERTREIGVLRAIGASHRAILMMIQVEGLVIALLSWMIALPLSLPMSGILGHAFGQIMIEVPVTWMPNPTGMARWLGVVVIVSVLACWWPARRAMRIPTARALAYA